MKVLVPRLAQDRPFESPPAPQKHDLSSQFTKIGTSGEAELASITEASDSLKFLESQVKIALGKLTRDEALTCFVCVCELASESGANTQEKELDGWVLESLALGKLVQPVPSEEEQQYQIYEPVMEEEDKENLNPAPPTKKLRRMGATYF